MKRLLRLAARLYPPWWRRRYAREFEAFLEDVEPGWGGLGDVMRGALVMQVRTLGAIPVLCTLAGAIIGGAVAVRAPVVYASSATIRLTSRDAVQPASDEEVRVSLERAVAASGGAPASIYLMLRSRDSAQAVAQLTYLDRDPAQAHRMAERLVSAIGTEHVLGSAEVLAPPRLPTMPVERPVATSAASGGAFGLLAGGIGLLLVRSRRRSANAGPR